MKIIPITKLSNEEVFKCGECLHYEKNKHRSNKDVCKNLGIRHFRKAPKCFTPNFTEVMSNIDNFISMQVLINTLSAKQKKIMLGVLRSYAITKKRPLKIGQKVYLNIRTAEYISNYLTGYVVGYTSVNEVIIGGSPERNARGKMFFAYLPSTKSLLTQKEWDVALKKMIKKGKLVDPRAEKMHGITYEKLNNEQYVVPTIDSVLEKPKKINKRKATLTEIMGIEKKGGDKVLDLSGRR